MISKKVILYVTASLLYSVYPARQEKKVIYKNEILPRHYYFKKCNDLYLFASKALFDLHITFFLLKLTTANCAHYNEPHKVNSVCNNLAVV